MSNLPEYKLIVAGGRDFNDYACLSAEILKLADNELVAFGVSIISGMARGADKLGWQFCQNNNVRCYEFPADWSQGRSAGIKRNMAMGDFADGLLAFWDGKSPGTRHMIQYMKGLGKPVRVIEYNAQAAPEHSLFKPAGEQA